MTKDKTYYIQVLKEFALLVTKATAILITIFITSVYVDITTILLLASIAISLYFIWLVAEINVENKDIKYKKILKKLGQDNERPV